MDFFWKPVWLGFIWGYIMKICILHYKAAEFRAVSYKEDKYPPLGRCSEAGCYHSIARRTKASHRDIVQFVPMREYSFHANSHSEAQRSFSEELLAEIPGQLCEYMRSRGFVPPNQTAAAAGAVKVGVQ